MSSVTDIECAILKLSPAEQRAIALHLGEWLVEEKPPEWCAATDEGIRALTPYESRPAPRETRARKSVRRVHASR